MRAAAITSVTFILAGMAFADAIGAIAGGSHPAVALQFAPHAPKALAAQADMVLSSGTSYAPDYRLIVALAKQSLQREAINPRALRLLGYAASAEGKPQRARTLITLSERLSRRELGAQLWLIEDCVSRNRLGEVLRHYDNALRTNSESGGLLFPVLTAALDQPEIQAALVPYLRENPPWLYSMLAYAIANSQNPTAIADTMMRGGGMPAKADYRELEAALLDKLHAQSNPADVRRYYLSLRDAYPAVLRAADFGATQVDPLRVPVAWRAIKSAGIEGNFSPTTRGARGRWEFSGYAAPGSSGLVARKLLFLDPGEYEITARVGEMSLPLGAQAKLMIGCYANGSLVRSWEADLKSKPLLSRFGVSAGCPSQYLDVAMSAQDGQEGALIVIRSIMIKRVRPSSE